MLTCAKDDAAGFHDESAEESIAFSSQNKFVESRFFWDGFVEVIGDVKGVGNERVKVGSVVNDDIEHLTKTRLWRQWVFARLFNL